MEKKFTDGKKVIKKYKNEISLLKQELDIFEQSKKKLGEKTYNLHSDQKLKEPKNSTIQEALSKSCKTDFPASLEKIPTPSSQQTYQQVINRSCRVSQKIETLQAVYKGRIVTC